MSAIALARVITRKGSTFVSVRNYRNSKGELSNQLFIAGYSYDNAKAHDLAVLQAANIAELAEQVDFPADLVQVAVSELIASATKPDAARSAGQAEAYTHIGSGVRVHNETGDLYIIGLAVKKKVLEKGEYKEVKSADKTICKNRIKKALQLRTDKIRNFKLEKGTFNLRGVTL